MVRETNGNLLLLGSLKNNRVFLKTRPASGGRCASLTCCASPSWRTVRHLWVLLDSRRSPRSRSVNRSRRLMTPSLVDLVNFSIVCRHCRLQSPAECDDVRYVTRGLSLVTPYYPVVPKFHTVLIFHEDGFPVWKVSSHAKLGRVWSDETLRYNEHVLLSTVG